MPILRVIRFLLFCCTGVLVFHAGLAHSQRADISVSPDSIPIGQHAALEILIEVPENSVLLWPGISDTLATDIEIIRFGRPDTLSHADGMISFRQQHIITAWRQGYLVIPPLAFRAVLQNDTLAFYTEALLLEVSGIDIDPESDIRDIKTIYGVPLAFIELLPWLAGFILLLSVAWFLVRYLGRRKKPEPGETIWEKPDIPAHIAAISSLERLKSKKLWQQGKVKQYHSELTDILRMYILKRFGVRAPEMTTSEITAVMPAYVPDETVVGGLRQLLELADLVKFARYRPEAQANETSMELSYSFVGNTKMMEKDAG